MLHWRHRLWFGVKLSDVLHWRDYGVSSRNVNNGCVGVILATDEDREGGAQVLDCSVVEPLNIIPNHRRDITRQAL